MDYAKHLQKEKKMFQQTTYAHTLISHRAYPHPQHWSEHCRSLHQHAQPAYAVYVARSDDIRETGRGVNDANIMVSNAIFHLAETTVVNTCLGEKTNRYAVKKARLFWDWRLWQT